jgi:hypothetical protein
LGTEVLRKKGCKHVNKNEKKKKKGAQCWRKRKKSRFLSGELKAWGALKFTINVLTNLVD